MATKFEDALKKAAKEGRVPICQCWDHLRAAGLTPSAALAGRHGDILGNIFRPANGRVDAFSTKAARESRSEAKQLMEKGRGQS